MNSLEKPLSCCYIIQHRKITISIKKKIYWRSVPPEKGKFSGKVNYKYIVQHPGTDVATEEISWCAPFRSIPLKGC